YVVLFFGGSWPSKRPELAAAAVEHLARRGVDAELFFVDSVPHDRVPTYINAANAVLLTSVTEGSPNIVKEALACEVAVVSVDVGDVSERLAGIDGCFIAKADPAALGDCLFAA